MKALNILKILNLTFVIQVKIILASSVIKVIILLIIIWIVLLVVMTVLNVIHQQIVFNISSWIFLNRNRWMVLKILH